MPKIRTGQRKGTPGLSSVFLAHVARKKHTVNDATDREIVMSHYKKAFPSRYQQGTSY